MFTLTLLATCTLFAQEGPRARIPSAAAVAVTTTTGGRFDTVPSADVHFDVDERGAHWARGANYKARFGADGATFIPFLGSDAPRNFPVRFTLVGASQGERAVSLAAPRVARQGERIVLDHGPVRAEYVVGPGGVEQLFVLDAPLSAGDLALELALESDLVLSANGAAWRFESDRGGVAYGAAVALDAAGRRLDLAVQRTAQGLRFEVPASFLARAIWPIAVDPLITTIAVDITPIDQFDADVAFDPTRGRYIVTFAEVYSAVDHDIKSWMVDAAGAVVASSERYFDFTATHRTSPRVALTNVRRAFLCVYTEGLQGRRIGARARLADTSALGARFLVDQGTAVERVQADVCGDSYTASASEAHFTVVWRRYWDPFDSDIVARVVDEDGAALTGELYVTDFIGVSDEAPAISKCIAPGTEDSVVVWRRDDSVWASLISYDGGVVRAEFPLATAAGYVGAPSVSALSTAPLLGSAHPTFVACWDVDYGPDRDLEAVVVAAVNSSAAPLVSDVQHLSFMEHVDYTLDQREPDVACVGERWVIAQNATFPGASDSVTRATTVGIVGSELGISERFVGLTQTYEETFAPRLASPFEAGAAANLEALVVWDQLAPSGATGSIYGARYAAPPEAPCGVQFVQCWGHPNGTYVHSRAFLWVEGDSNPTHPKRLHALDLHANAFGYFLASPQVTTTAGVTPPGSAGVLCLSGSIGRCSNFVLNTGPAGAFSLALDPTAIPQPTGSVPALAGQVWFFQAWHRDVRPGGGPPTSNFTNVAGVPFY